MNPWDIIGWGVLAIIVLFVFLRFLLPFIVVTVLFVIHLKTKPKEGQVWLQPFSGRNMEITFVRDGRVGIDSYMPGNRGRIYAGYSYTEADWKNVQRRFWMHLDHTIKPRH